ncbi:MAG: ABC transporter permease subunit [Anaerolineales bacterium]|nr:ABC transporter permease subunit [Anaerolineales bacterium]
MNFMAVFRKEMLEQWRTYRFLIVAAVFTAFGLSSPLLAKFTPEMLKSIPGVPTELLAAFPAPTVTDAITQYVKNMSQFGILLALLMTMGVVVQEKERGTAAFFLTRPVSRETFLLTKFAALIATFIASLALAAVGCWYYTLVLFEPLAWGPFLVLNGLILVVILVYMALALLASTIARSNGVAVGLAFVALILIGGLGALPRIGDYFPGRLFSWGVTLMMGGNDTAWWAFGISLGIIAAALIIACIVFRRQEV